jgi:hypothetical protein
VQKTGNTGQQVFGEVMFSKTQHINDFNPRAHDFVTMEIILECWVIIDLIFRVQTTRTGSSTENRRHACNTMYNVPHFTAPHTQKQEKYRLQSAFTRFHGQQITLGWETNVIPCNRTRDDCNGGM